MNSISFQSIGTKWQIDLENSKTSHKEKIESRILKFLGEFDRTYSRFRKDSLVSQIAKKKGSYNFPKEADNIFRIYKKLYDLTDGKFSPLVGNLLNQLGYDDKYSLEEKEKSKVKSWNEIIDYNKGKLHTKEPVILDFGAAGKGYAIDEISKILDKSEVKKYIIDAGGDIKVKNDQTIRIGLEHPANLNQAIGVVEIKEGSICASSGNRRKWSKYHHIVDPKSLNSAKSILSSWVISKSSFEADALATCLFLDNPDKLKKEFDFEYLILYPDYTIDKSENFSAEIFYNK